MYIVEDQTFDENHGNEYSYVYINTTFVEKHPTQCLSDNQVEKDFCNLLEYLSACIIL